MDPMCRVAASPSIDQFVVHALHLLDGVGPLRSGRNVIITDGLAGPFKKGLPIFDASLFVLNWQGGGFGMKSGSRIRDAVDVIAVPAKPQGPARKTFDHNPGKVVVSERRARCKEMWDDAWTCPVG